jgi:hypothetical protein
VPLSLSLSLTNVPWSDLPTVCPLCCFLRLLLVRLNSQVIPWFKYYLLNNINCFTGYKSERSVKPTTYLHLVRYLLLLVPLAPVV